MFKCYWKSTYGIECLGCGFQRAFYLLLEGRIVDSFKMYPALIPLIFTFVFTIAHLKFKIKNGATFIVVFFSISIAIMLISYLYNLFL